MTNQEIILLIGSVVITWLVCMLYHRQVLSHVRFKCNTLIDNNKFLHSELTQEKELLTAEREQKSELKLDIAGLESELKNIRDRFFEYRNDLESQDARFKVLANQILDEKSKRFDEQQKKGIHDLLEPLKDKISAFEEKVDKTNIASAQRHASLKEQVSFLSAHSDKVARDANNLAKALRGDFKKQGNWGELILDSILEKSGLVKGREYFTQNSKRNDDGKLQRPDVIIDTPQGKKIIIDSKVSLNAYNGIIAAEDEETAILSKRAHVIAVKKHVDDLSAKNYHDLYKHESPDFVMMFIPIDTAFSAALEHDPDLYNYAFEKNIVIVSASTLLATLKTVESMWRNDKYNKNAMAIASEAGKMYDKFVGFTEDMERMGQQLDTVKTTYNTSVKKLSLGQGNLIKRAERIKALGAKANKTLKLEAKAIDAY